LGTTSRDSFKIKSNIEEEKLKVLSIFFFLFFVDLAYSNPENCSKHTTFSNCRKDPHCRWDTKCIPLNSILQKIEPERNSIYDPNPQRKLQERSMTDPRKRRQINP